MFQSRLSSHGYRRVALSEDQADFEDGEREAEESVQNFLRTSRKKTEGTEQELEVFRKRDQELRDGDEGGDDTEDTDLTVKSLRLDFSQDHTGQDPPL